MKEMMKQLYGPDGRPDPDKMMQFIEHGKQLIQQFTDKDGTNGDYAQVRELCDQIGMPEMSDRMVQMLQTSDIMRFARGRVRRSSDLS